VWVEGDPVSRSGGLIEKIARIILPYINPGLNPKVYNHIGISTGMERDEFIRVGDVRMNPHGQVGVNVFEKAGALNIVVSTSLSYVDVDNPIDMTAFQNYMFKYGEEGQQAFDKLAYGKERSPFGGFSPYYKGFHYQVGRRSGKEFPIARFPTGVIEYPNDDRHMALNLSDAQLSEIVRKTGELCPQIMQSLEGLIWDVAASVSDGQRALERFLSHPPQPDAPAVEAPPEPKGPEYSVVLTYKGVVLEVVPVETQQEAIDAMTSMQGDLRIKTVKGGSSKGAKANPYGKRRFR
jgi:hypothetical protein